MRVTSAMSRSCGQVSIMSMMAAMSRVTAVDSRSVTVCQWRSMKTKAMTDWSRIIGAMTMMSERA